MSFEFAFNPDNRPARLIRYLDDDAFDAPRTLAVYDYGKNLLVINKLYYDDLLWSQKHLLLRTQHAFTPAP